MGFLRKCVLKLLYVTGLYLWVFSAVNKTFSLNILSAKETINQIKKGRTLIRFGDGELRLIMKVGEAGFQKRNSRLEADLAEILVSCRKTGGENILLCMPGVLSGSQREYQLTKDVSFWWFVFTVKYFRKLRSLFLSCGGISFGDSFVSRPYYAIRDFEFASYVFAEFKNIFSGKRLLIIEGRLTRFGVGNDLLDGAISVRRILGPEVDAYDKVDEIYERAKGEICDIVLIALGPAAKILAYRLNELGYCCLDVGHLDIQYEWYKMNAKEKIAIANKYVNESKEKFVETGDIDESYERQVFCRF